MSDLTLGERLIVVETKLADDIQDGLRREAKQTEILQKLEALEKSMASAKSFIGGAMWIGGAMAAVLLKIGPWIINYFRAKTGN